MTIFIFYLLLVIVEAVFLNQSMLLRLVYGYAIELTNEEVEPCFIKMGSP